jgi:stage II sporulation protein D
MKQVTLSSPKGICVCLCRCLFPPRPQNYRSQPISRRHPERSEGSRLFLLLVFLFPTPAQARAQAPAATLTIRVLTTQTVTTLHIAPAPAVTLRTCPACPARPLTTPIDLTLDHGQMHLANGPSLTRIQLTGSLRLTPNAATQTVSAAGEWSIAPGPASLRILLTLPSVRYVAAVLAGEAAPDEPLASLKALAVVARTFALANPHRHAAEGFGLCDSTHCQALRLGTTSALIEQAVRETAGETLWFGSPTPRRAQVFFSQACGGTTEAAVNVWPNIHAPYLTAHPDPYCLRRNPALWHADIPFASLARILHAERFTTPSNIDAARILRRTPSGRAQLIEFTGAGTHATVSASSLRFAVNRALGWNTMRSDTYDLSVLPGKAGPTLHLQGRGFGHGVGLCQAGAAEMAIERHPYRDILAFYFPGSTLGLTPTDTGWTATEATGWTLRAVPGTKPVTLTKPGAPSNAASPRWMGHPAITLQAGDTAWTHALHLFPPRSTPPHPTVFATPTTELFRQMTAQPGWLLASTRGDQVYLQPAAILGTAVNDTLLHEFLHVLIEQEAAPTAPLWLREGLAEALADPHAPHLPAITIPIPQLDAALTNPPTPEASRKAHAAAATLTARLIARYGLPTVRTWLRTPIPPQALQP